MSQATIRRDLEALQQQRLISRTHGGAIIHAAFNDLPLSYKTAQDLPEKQRIARCAAQFLDGARVIGTTGGTTVSQFARLLRDRDGLTVVTNALNIAVDLLGNPRLRVFLAGGEVRGSSQEAVGHSAEAFLADYNTDVAFLGVDGVDAVAGLHQLRSGRSARQRGAVPARAQAGGASRRDEDRPGRARAGMPDGRGGRADHRQPGAGPPRSTRSAARAASVICAYDARRLTLSSGTARSSPAPSRPRARG